MEVSDERDDILIRYLLNDLSKEQNEEVEDKMVLDPEFSERAQAVEASLIESYVLDEMSAVEKIRFAKGYLIFPENRDKVEDARAFQEALRQPRRKRQVVPLPTPAKTQHGWLASLLRMPAPALAFAALVLIAVVVAGLLLINQFGSNQVASDNRNGQENARPQVVSHPRDNRNDNFTRDTTEETAKAPTNNATNKNLPSDKEVAKLPTHPPGVVVASIDEKRGRVGASPMGPGDEVKVQSVRIPAGAKSFTLKVSLEPVEYFEESLDCSVDISSLKFARLYPAADYLKVKARPAAGKFQVAINIPTIYVKEGEFYYFRVKEIDSHTPFRVSFTK